MWETIVLNLLSNALKYTFDGRIEVALRYDEDARQVAVTVRDTGTGISAAELPNLFERFRRIEGARGRSHEGSGIGLALVQELVKLHGGWVEVASELQRGSTFTVILPLGSEHLPADRIGAGAGQVSTNVRAQAYIDEALTWLGEAVDALDEAPPSAAAESLAPVTRTPGARDSLILLADDNADMRHYVERLLRIAGYKVEAVPDGEAALAAARRLKPDLILSDVMMPKLDGFGLIAALRTDDALRDTPVLILSARADDEAKLEGFKSGADNYLIKPFTAAELLARTDVQLKLSGMRRASARALREEAETLDRLNKVGNAIAAEIDLERAVQLVTDLATELVGAEFGAFFYNVSDAAGESYMLYTLAGAPREAFAAFPMPRNTAVFAATFGGEGIVRSADITEDARYGRSAPHYGMPKGHLPVRSYLAAPVISPSGEVLGGLFFGHSAPDVFDERCERLIAGIAVQAAIAIDKARLYQSAQDEIERRRRIEAALRDSEQLLERKVDERTAELKAANDRLQAEAAEREKAEEALRQAQKMESIGQLTGGVAHDFNNLLTVIVGNLGNIQRYLADPAGNSAALSRSTDHAMRGAQRAASLTQRLLAFARQQPLDPKPVDVNRLVTGMSDLLRRTIGEQISIETVLAGGLWGVSCDPNQLEIAMLNLAVNARDAMPDGGRLTIETANAHLDDEYARAQAEVIAGQYVSIAVSDSGTGMSPDTVARAFEPFFTTKDIGQGTGLGLSQVYGFIKQSGGHVKIYSELGQGTTVRIYLPRLHSAIDGEPVRNSFVPTPRAVRGETILVVEDDPDVRVYTVGLLQELGYSVIEAREAASALSLLQATPDICLIFTDVGLPGGMNGRQLVDRARIVKPGIKVLFTTGYARNAIVHDGRLDPGVQLLTKPFSQVELAAKIRDVIDARADGAPSRILFIEDDALVQIFAADHLEERGFTVDCTGSGTDGLNRLRLNQGAYDAAVVDLGLPDRDGLTVVGEIRALYPAPPVIIASGRNESAVTDRFADDPTVVVLPKPYQSEDLDAALETLGVKAPPPRGR